MNSSPRATLHRSLGLVLCIPLLGLSPGCGEDTTASETDVVGDTLADADPEDFTLLPIEAEPTRDDGDAERGRELMLGGWYEGGGMPYELFVDLFEPDPANLLGRTGRAANLPPAFNLVEADSGVEFVASSCLACHSGEIDGQFIEGLPNAFPREEPSLEQLQLLRDVVASTYGADSEEATIYDRMYFPLEASSKLPLPFDGLVSSMTVGLIGFAHRDPAEMTWNAEPSFPLDIVPLGSDPIPWWHLQKQHASFINGMSRGDQARHGLLATIFTTAGREQLEALDEQAPDLLAYMKSLQAPAYPGAIDSALADQGQPVFEATCSTCHGTYGDVETYPNLLVHVDVVGTDPYYAEQWMAGDIAALYGDSWWGSTGALPSRIEPHRAYLAPPLDGIWATAPYLHPGCIPTLAGVIDSSKRPTYWRRDFETRTYDVDAPGLVFEETAGPEDGAYDTTLPGYGNQGHTFGDALSAGERRALLEYLKTL